MVVKKLAVEFSVLFKGMIFRLLANHQHSRSVILDSYPDTFQVNLPSLLTKVDPWDRESLGPCMNPRNIQSLIVELIQMKTWKSLIVVIFLCSWLLVTSWHKKAQCHAVIVEHFEIRGFKNDPFLLHRGQNWLECHFQIIKSLGFARGFKNMHCFALHWGPWFSS